MRLVVACPKCGRRYDVGSRPIGSRFCCRCGAAVTIRPQHHCNGDGATTPERLSHQKTSAACPACGRGARLAERKIGEAVVLECGRCAGLWLGVNVFQKMVEQASREAVGIDPKFKPQPARARRFDSDDPYAPRYRLCPVCGKLMNRQNYGHRSGVVIDVCRAHGVWFDADELPRILEWVRSGRLADVRQEEAREAERQSRRQWQQKQRQVTRGGSMSVTENEQNYLPFSGTGAILDLVLFAARWFL